jgi:hypothetical protein
MLGKDLVFSQKTSSKIGMLRSSWFIVLWVQTLFIFDLRAENKREPSLLEDAGAFCRIFLAEKKQKLYHKMQLYPTTRTLKEYERVLKKELLKELEKLDFNGHWIDLGAGQAVAQKEYFKKRFDEQKPALRLSAVVLDSPLKVKVDQYLGRHSEVEFFTGKPFEEYAYSTFRPADVITDVMGAFHYSSSMDRVLNQSLRVLKVGGVFMSNVPLATEIRTVRGQILSPHQWVALGKGVEVQMDTDFYMLKVKKISENASVPPLALTYLKVHPLVVPERHYTLTK